MNHSIGINEGESWRCEYSLHSVPQDNRTFVTLWCDAMSEDEAMDGAKQTMARVVTGPITSTRVALAAICHNDFVTGEKYWRAYTRFAFEPTEGSACAQA